MVAQVVLEIDTSQVITFHIYSCVGLDLMYQLHSVTRLCCLILLVILQFLSCGHFLVAIILTVFVPKTKIQTLYDKRSSIVYVLWDKKKVYL